MNKNTTKPIEVESNRAIVECYKLKLNKPYSNYYEIDHSYEDS